MAKLLDRSSKRPYSYNIHHVNHRVCRNQQSAVSAMARSVTHFMLVVVR